jgi:hypothetical protein
MSPWPMRRSRAVATTGKHVVAVPDVVHLLQHRERGIGEWHATFLPRLHATGRDGPQLRPHIDFVPGGTQRLAGAGGGKDEKFEGACGRNTKTVSGAMDWFLSLNETLLR